VTQCWLQDQDADIPLPNEPDDRDYQSDDSRKIQDAGSDDEGEDLQEDAERSDLYAVLCCVFWECMLSKTYICTWHNHRTPE